MNSRTVPCGSARNHPLADIQLTILKRRWLAALPTLAAVVCVCIMAWLILQIDDTRYQLQNDSIAASQMMKTGTQETVLDPQMHGCILERMNSLYLALWICGAMFLITLLFTLYSFVILSRRADNLNAQAIQAETRLDTAMSRLTSEDKARKAQNSFVAAASHDLRQPLHALGLYMEALRGHVGTAQGMRILENSCRSAEALNQLLNSMLDLSKLDTGMMDVNPEHLALQDVFDRLHQTFAPDARQRGLQLSMNARGQYVCSDPVLLERVLANLMSNALHYTERGAVYVHASRSANKVNISVQDTGCGIAPEEQHAIFDEYYQLHNPERDRTKGLGIGLSIVKRLTPLLGATLSLDSEPNMGSEFALRLPIGDSKLCAKEPLQPRHSVECHLHGLSILVIDDEGDVREGMSTLLDQYHCRAVSLESAQSALQYIVDKEWEPDLIIADYRLRDDQTGSEAIDLIREELNRDVPAMIITGDTSSARLREAASSGFELLHKPVDAGQLLQSIAKINGENL